MTLQEFVRESLLQISRGVREAYVTNTSVGMAISALGNQISSVTTDDGKAGVMVEFDVAVTITEKAEANGGANISVATVFAVGGKASSSLETSSISRIKFSVPIVYGID